MFKVQIGLWSGCLDTDPKQRFVPGDLHPPDSLVTQLGSKMLTTGGGRDLEQSNLLFGFHFGLLYKWPILLFRADPCVLGMMVITLRLHLSAQHMTTALSLLAPSKLSHLICPQFWAADQTASCGLVPASLASLLYPLCTPIFPLLFSCQPPSQVISGLFSRSNQYSDDCSLHRFISKTSLAPFLYAPR